MGGYGHEGIELEYDSVDDAVCDIGCRDEHNKHDDVLGIEDEQPSEDSTDDTTNVLDKPDAPALKPVQAPAAQHRAALPDHYVITVA